MFNAVIVTVTYQGIKLPKPGYWVHLATLSRLSSANLGTPQKIPAKNVSNLIKQRTGMNNSKYLVT